MLDIDNNRVCELLVQGKIGLEKESLRITKEGYLAETPHPFPGDPFIVRDFCENQAEINTTARSSALEAIEELKYHTRRIEKALSEREETEYLWPFSNPPYIRKESEIPIARYGDAEKEKERYREYLAERYGRYKMTFSGIHYNYSFSDELLEEDFAAKARKGLLCGQSRDFRAYKDAFYVSLAAKAQIYNWLIVAITAASPLLDSSYVEKGILGKDIFNGMASTRCSELGYWNLFTPVLDYSGLPQYVDSVLSYLDAGLIRSPTELYYPVRLKPAGSYSLQSLKQNGVSHIELRMVDLNPLDPAGLDVRDAYFIQLLLIYLAILPDLPAGPREQVFAIQNTKNAAHYDLKTVNLVTPDMRTLWVADAACELLQEMKTFFKGRPACREVDEVLDYQIGKFADAGKRYAWIIRERFSGGFVEKGLELCRERAKEQKEDCGELR